MKILLIRHAETDCNSQGVFTGVLDVKLSELGKIQAEKACEYIGENYKVDRIYISPKDRTINTVKPLADKLGLNIEFDERLCEINGGVWEGMTMENILKNYTAEFSLWKTDIERAKCPGGEGFKEVGARGVSALTDIANANPDKTVLVGSHGGIMRTVVCIIKGLPLASLSNVEWTPNASFCEIDFENGKFSVIKENFCEYLEDIKTNLKLEF